MIPGEVPELIDKTLQGIIGIVFLPYKIERNPAMRIRKGYVPHRAWHAAFQVLRNNKESTVDAGKEDAFLYIIDLFNNIAFGSYFFKELAIKVSSGRILNRIKIDHREAGEITDGENLVIRQRVIGMHDCAEREMIDGLTLQTSLKIFCDISNDAEIDLSCIELAEQTVQSPAVQVKADRWMRSGIFADKLGKKTLGSHRQKAKLNLTGRIHGSFFHQKQSPVVMIDDFLGFMVEEFSDAGQVDAVGVSDKKRSAKSIFQVMNMTTERRLGQI